MARYDIENEEAFRDELTPICRYYEGGQNRDGYPYGGCSSPKEYPEGKCGPDCPGYKSGE